MGFPIKMGFSRWNMGFIWVGPNGSCLTAQNGEGTGLAVLYRPITGPAGIFWLSSCSPAKRAAAGVSFHRRRWRKGLLISIAAVLGTPPKIRDRRFDENSPGVNSFTAGSVWSWSSNGTAQRRWRGILLLPSSIGRRRLLRGVVYCAVSVRAVPHGKAALL